MGNLPVPYTHLDVYKRQLVCVIIGAYAALVNQTTMRRLISEALTMDPATEPVASGMLIRVVGPYPLILDT